MCIPQVETESRGATQQNGVRADLGPDMPNVERQGRDHIIPFKKVQLESQNSTVVNQPYYVDNEALKRTIQEVLA